ncbi:MAG TPA: hypothetical protein VK571_11000 [Gemmatimonadaceae bacterium]|nr:hypothetical protein [Gemmatimonadaceae bacterium]
MSKLIGEMRGWGDLLRVAAVIPIEVLEAAYIAKLDALPPLPHTPLRAETRRQKLLVMRQIFAAWLRAPTLRLRQLFYAALDEPDHRFGKTFYNREDQVLASQVLRYTRPE